MKEVIDRPDPSEVLSLRAVEVKRRIKRFYVGCPVCLCDIEADDEHLGMIERFGFVIRKGSKKFVALTSSGKWYLLEDLIYCPAPAEQIQLRDKIRAKNKLCTIAEWEAMNGRGCPA